MPLIFRAMRPDGGRPVIGHIENDTLGVREKILRLGQEVGDIRPLNGLVHPQTGGMSVSPSKEELPPHLIPKRHRGSRYPYARRGSTKLDTFPWKMGEGEFQAGWLCDRLQLSLDPHDSSHGFVEPDQPMSLADHRLAVEATRPNWIQEEW
jgi:hypothetical protein